MKQKQLTGRRWAVLEDRPSPDRIKKTNYDLAVFLPSAEKATGVAKAALDEGSPACILMPSTLVCRVGGQKEQIQVRGAAKIALLQPELTWLCLHLSMASVVRAAWKVESLLEAAPTDNGLIVAPPELTHDQWLRLQASAIDKYSREHVSVRQSDGLAFYTPEPGTAKLIVPEEFVSMLVNWTGSIGHSFTRAPPKSPRRCRTSSIG